MLNLSDLNVAVVGGFGGIGREICKVLLDNGISSLAILDLKEDVECLKFWQSNYPNGNIFFVPIDVVKKAIVEEAIDSVINKIKRIDIFINTSGVLADNNVELTVQVNLLGPIYTTKAALERMGKHNGGQGGLIVNVASVLGLEPSNAFPVYSSTKHGVIGFTRSLSDEFYFNKTGVRLLTICPGITRTNLIQDPEQATLFPFAQHLGTHFMAAKTQPSDICAENIIEAIKSNKNGSIWICDLGTLEEVNPTQYWQTQYDN